MAQHFQAYEGKPLTIPAEAVGPKPEYLEWHRKHFRYDQCDHPLRGLAPSL